MQEEDDSNAQMTEHANWLLKEAEDLDVYFPELGMLVCLLHVLAWIFGLFMLYAVLSLA